MAADAVDSAQSPQDQQTLTIPQQWRNPFTPRPQLINALIGQEDASRNPKAVGKVGERGLMQIRPETAAQYGVKPEQLFDPTINQQTGSRYLGDLLKRYNGNEFLALVAYNSGPARVDRGELLPQSVRYASKILGMAKGGGSMPTLEAQPGGKTQAPEPSMLSRIGGLFEGTANAQEFPPLPSGAKVSMPSVPPSGAPAAPMGQTPQAGPTAPTQDFPPLPSGAKPRFDPQQWKMSMSMGATGPHFSLQQREPTQQELSQAVQIQTARQGLNDMLSAAKGVLPEKPGLGAIAGTGERWLKFQEGDPAVTKFDASKTALISHLRAVANASRVNQYELAMASNAIGEAKSYPALEAAVQEAQKRLDEIQQASQQYYPNMPGAPAMNSPMPQQAQAPQQTEPQGMPEGAQLMPGKTTRDGNPVYQLPDGRLWTPD
jgi:hypothetical protein